MITVTTLPRHDREKVPESDDRKQSTKTATILETVQVETKVDSGDEKPGKARITLETLPAEIRCKIWEEFLLDCPVVKIDLYDQRDTAVRRRKAGIKYVDVNLFQVNHQVYEEARNVFFKKVPCTVNLLASGKGAMKGLLFSTSQAIWESQIADSSKFRTLLLYTPDATFNSWSHHTQLMEAIPTLQKLFVAEDNCAERNNDARLDSARKVFIDIAYVGHVMRYHYSPYPHKGDIKGMLEAYAALNGLQNCTKELVMVQFQGERFSASGSLVSSNDSSDGLNEDGLGLISKLLSTTKTVERRTFWE